MHDTKRKLLITLVLLGIVGTVTAYGTYSAFSASTANTGNSFAAGTVAIGDNDGGTAAMFNNVTDQKPGVNVERCIKVTYSGSLPADVRLYTTTTPHATANHINLKIEKGTSDATTFPNCGTFVAESTLYDGTLANFGGGASPKNSWATGLAACPGLACDPTAANSWTSTAPSNALVYRFTMNFADSGSGAQSGSTEFKWEAQNE